MTLASRTWLLQPQVEKSREDKLCASCLRPASLTCTSCRCTLYCSRLCQRKDWRTGHKARCSLDPLYALAPALTLPHYREFSREELQEKRLSFTLQPGPRYLLTDACELREVACGLLTATQPSMEDYLSQPAEWKGLPSRQLLQLMGWLMAGTEVVTGWGREDSVIFRVYFDDNWENHPELEVNKLASFLMNNNREHRGRIVVVKELINWSTGASDLLPLSKAEVVDLITWRAFLGSHGLVSSRIYRENIRRAQLQDHVTKMGFQTLFM